MALRHGKHDPVLAQLHATTSVRGAISIRGSLLVSMLGLVLLIALALLVVMTVSALRLAGGAARSIIEARNAQVESELAVYIAPVEGLLNTAQSLASAGLIGPLDAAGNRYWLGELAHQAPLASALWICDAGGNGYTLQRSPDGGWLEAQRSSTGKISWTERADPAGPARRSWEEPAGADWRGTHWYVGAATKQTDTTHWTQPYDFVTEEDPGISASRLIKAPAGSFVLSLDLRVAVLDEFTDALDPTPNGYVLLMDSTGELLEPLSDTEDEPAVEVDELARGAQPPAKRGIEDDHELMETALQAWETRYGLSIEDYAAQAAARPGPETHAEEQPFLFKRGNTRWWGGMRPFNLGGDSVLLIAVLLPENDLLMEAGRMRVTMVLIALLAVVLAVVLAFSLARALGAPISTLALQSERLRRLDLTADASPPLRSRVKEVAQLAAAHASMRSALDSFSRYVPTELVRELLDRGEAAHIGGRLLPLTVLITDISGFTALCEALPPQALAAQLEEYFECLLRVLVEAGATVDKLVGDSVVCFWGAPQPDANQADHAVRCALSAADSLAELNAQWQAAGKPSFETKIGIASGDVIVGNIGTRWRLNYTALGSAVNLASRLEKVCPMYRARVIVSAPVRQACRQSYRWRLLGEVSIRGRQSREEIYEPLYVTDATQE